MNLRFKILVLVTLVGACKTACFRCRPPSVIDDSSVRGKIAGAIKMNAITGKTADDRADVVIDAAADIPAAA